MNPDMVCFFLHESHKEVVESQIPPALSRMPQRWDWIFTPSPESFSACQKALAQRLGPLLTTWNVMPGELVIDITSATVGMASAMVLTGFPFSTKVLLCPGPLSSSGDQTPEEFAKQLAQTDTSANPWDEEAPRLRHETCYHFNHGSYDAAVKGFHTLEHRISGGMKPFYRALADVAQGYGLWDQLLYRPAWEKLKGGIKALELASVWGAPPGMDRLIHLLKGNLTFLERIVLDSKDIKPAVALDLLAWAKRRGDRGRDLEVATHVLLRALEAFAQSRLYTQYHLKSWDVTLEQLPEDLRDTCRRQYCNEIDGKYRLPLQAQFQTLAGLGDPMGQRFVTDWPKMKSLFDAADHALLGYGFEPIKPERFHQLYDLVIRLSEVAPTDLPEFPSLNV
ncbi:MAG TPA: TIGR02710 family CRISPR-associated protein [Nitrospiraceae bacterium]|nr:TIGR02710 family CRISPR-associated protein [Nitrospiraceae bacterium]